MKFFIVEYIPLPTNIHLGPKYLPQDLFSFLPQCKTQCFTTYEKHVNIFKCSKYI